MHILFTVIILGIIAIAVLLILFLTTSFSTPVARVYYTDSVFENVVISPTHIQQVLTTDIYADPLYYSKLGTLKQNSEFFKKEGENYTGTIIRHYNFGSGETVSSINTVYINTPDIQTYIPPYNSSQKTLVYEATGGFKGAKGKNITVTQISPTMALTTFYNVV